VVIAGIVPRERGMELAKLKWAQNDIMLPMSVPHIALVKGAAQQLRDYLGNVQVQTPAIPVLQNADVRYTAMVRQSKVAGTTVIFAVRWVETVVLLACRVLRII